MNNNAGTASGSIQDRPAKRWWRLPVYIYAADLVRHLKRIWKKTKLYVQEEEVPLLPEDAVIRRLLDVCYHASLLTEERRQPTFRVVYCPKAEFDTAGGRVKSTVKIHFSRPVPFNEKQLLQLSPATDPTSVMVAVEAVEGTEEAENLRSRGKTVEPGALQMWGLLDTGSSWWAHQRRESERQINSPPDLLTISSSKPGRLSVSRAWRILLTLENGQLTSPAADLFVTSPIAADFEEPITKLYERVYADYQTDDPYEPLLNRHNCSVRYITCIKRLLTYFQDKPHGSILLLLPDEADAQEDFEELMHMKYGCRHYELWSKLRQSLELRRRWFEIGSAIARGGEQCEKNQVVELSRLRTAVDELEHQITDGLQVIAALSGVDGAVVLTDRLRLVGFGAELRASSKLQEISRATDAMALDRERIAPESFGTRHRSTFRFIHKFARGAAFVHSQDGGMRAVKKIGDEVVYWDMDPGND